MMITVELNEANFEYDIHSLVKAFYPGHDVLVKAQPRASFPDSLFHLEVCYGEKEITFSFFRGCLWPAEMEVPGSVPGGSGSLIEESSSDAPEDVVLLRGSTATDPADRKETKDRLKRRLYQLLSEFSGQTLPWGTLTGIRPTKIPMTMLEEGCSEEEIRAHMRESYFTSDEKIGLSIDVAKRELQLLSRIDYEDGYSLYVGIPFCPSTCLYCSFASYPIRAWKNRVDEYLDALCREIEATAALCRDKYLNAVYIGGGTPTSLEPEQLDRLICQIGRSFHLFDEREHILYGGLQEEEDMISRGFDGAAEGAVHPLNHLLEFTVEAGRPDSITREKLQVLRNHNISRISINPQTMKEETLRIIGRQHTAEQTRESFRLAREMGFDNINMDLIVGLPEETIEDVRNTMEELMLLAPDNVTVHSLAVKRAARLKMNWEEYEHLHMENTWEIIRLTEEYCRRMGLEPYYLYRQKNMAGNFENVGYAAQGKAGVYNILIMEEKQTIMALGAGATTKVVTEHGAHIERVGNVKDITNYLERVDEMIDRKARLIRQCGWQKERSSD